MMTIVSKEFPSHAFTLIELLIVVAIIAILAAIAIPNFLEAQVRAKVSRARADHRTIATGLEAYAADTNHYPLNDGVYNVVPIQLTTPIRYLTNSLLVDPFSDKERVYNRPGVDPELARYYTYTKIVTYQELSKLITNGGPLPPIEAVDAPGFNPGAFDRYGQWRLVSNGPDRKYRVLGAPRDAFNPNPSALQGADIPYDPTNGTVSHGNILRTQKRSEGYVLTD